MLKGQHHTEETKKRMSKKLKGRCINSSNLPEVRAKISKTVKQWHKTHKNPMQGKHHSEETKKKISARNKGRLLGVKRPEVGIKISKALKGRTFSLETRAKMSKSAKQKFVDHPELLQKIIEKTKLHLKICGNKHTGTKHSFEWRKNARMGIERWRDQTGIICTYPKPEFVEELGHGVRSSWEKEFSFMLKNAGITYAYESKFFKVLMSDGQLHRYYPDFKINDNCFIETKGFIQSEGISKLNAFTIQYPNIKLIVLGLDTHIEERNQLKCRVIPWSERVSLVEELKCFS